MAIRTEQRTRAARAAANGLVRTPRPVRYPEGDGKPMAETGVHVRALLQLLALLQSLFRNRADVHVCGNMMMYWIEGDPRHRVSPDVFVTIGASAEPARRTWQTWVDGVPTVTFEITSRSTRRRDLELKRLLYQQLGVQEYYLFDPLGEYLRPPLHGFRLVDGVYQPLSPDADGGLISEALNARFLSGGDHLRLFDQGAGVEIYEPIARSAVLTEQVEIMEEQIESLGGQVVSLGGQVVSLGEQVEILGEEKLALLQQLEASRRQIAELERQLRERDSR